MPNNQPPNQQGQNKPYSQNAPSNRGTEANRNPSNQRPAQGNDLSGDRARVAERNERNNNDVGKDTDGDNRPVKPGHKPGEIDGDRQRHQNERTQRR
ncbi:MAG: hypothetical protein R3E60_00955 [Alphaproteobacteria bacterium]